MKLDSALSVKQTSAYNNNLCPSTASLQRNILLPQKNIVPPSSAYNHDLDPSTASHPTPSSFPKVNSHGVNHQWEDQPPLPYPSNFHPLSFSSIIEHSSPSEEHYSSFTTSMSSVQSSTFLSHAKTLSVNNNDNIAPLINQDLSSLLCSPSMATKNVINWLDLLPPETAALLKGTHTLKVYTFYSYIPYLQAPVTFP
jgi:hypothetical protein